MKGFDAIALDCDSTLFTVEGIDELATEEQKPEIERITNAAMGSGMKFEDALAARLNIIQPTLHEVDQLGELYAEHFFPEVGATLDALHQCGKEVLLVSGGFKRSIVKAIYRGGYIDFVDPDNVFAVELEFDDEGKYAGFDRSQAILADDGKRQILADWKRVNPGKRICMVGDGMTDYATHDVVDGFVGFGGVRIREQVKAKAPFYFAGKSMLDLLPYFLDGKSTV